MYFDTKPCEVCGAEVELRAHPEATKAPPESPVGPTDGVVGDADSTVDVRVCTNAACPTRQARMGP